MEWSPGSWVLGLGSRADHGAVETEMLITHGSWRKYATRLEGWVCRFVRTSCEPLLHAEPLSISYPVLTINVGSRWTHYAHFTDEKTKA